VGSGRRQGECVHGVRRGRAQAVRRHAVAGPADRSQQRHGKQVASLPAAGGVDDLAYDAARKRIYLSAGEGFVNVYQQKTPDTYEAVAQIPTGPGARNSRFVPEQNRLYVAVPAGKDKAAEVQVYDVSQ
jgi:hypothetical protein